MKKNFLLSIFVTFYFISFSQIATENVNFDNYFSNTNNDLTNNFSPPGDFAQLQNSGITGGCLQTTNSSSNSATYCSRFKHFVGSTDTVSVSFKCDTLLINPNVYVRAAEIYLNPRADGNHYINAYLKLEKSGGIFYGGIQISCYSTSFTSSTSFSMTHGKWYKFSIITKVSGGTFGDQVDITSLVHDLGNNGTAIPSLINTTTGTTYDLTLATDTSVSVSFTGSRWGGAIYFDNFHFSGTKSSLDCSSNCSLNINEQPSNQIGAVEDTSQFAISAYSAYNFQWQLDRGSGFQDISDTGQFRGTQTQILTVNGLIVTNNNQKFRCYVTSGPCKKYSNYGTLSVTNSSTSSPNGKVGINIEIPKRNLHVNDVLRLQPRDTPPTNPAKGDMYFDNVLNKLRVYDGTRWNSCW